jgi:energy-coupling factor transporter ATP-binding protein EcfA2
LIEISGLSFTYRGGTGPTLRGLNLRVERGEFLLLVGDSGSGKTTLAKILAGFLGSGQGSMEGTVRVGGDDPQRGSSAPEPAVGLVQQDPESQVVTLRVEDEVAFGPENFGLDREEIRARVRWALGSVRADGLIDREVSTLSGGEVQKVAIASILALRPRILILDEPSSSLDPRSAYQLAEILGALNSGGVTVIVVEHHYAWIMPKVQRVLRLSEGALAPLDSGVRGKRPPLPKAAPRVQVGAGTSLSMRNVSFEYDAVSALRGVSLDLQRGEILGLMGDNGSGKSTMLLVIMGFLSPSQGSITLNGRPLMMTSRISERVGIVFQNPNHQILESTVRKELLFGPRNFGMDPRESERRAQGMLEELGLSRYREDNPHRLSLGEKRRLNVGSVAIYDPAIYLLDEPFIGQDDGNTSRIMGLIQDRVGRGSSCVIATHHPDFVWEHCDRVAFLRDGSISHLGHPLDVFTGLEEEGQKWYLPSAWDDVNASIVS